MIKNLEKLKILKVVNDPEYYRMTQKLKNTIKLSRNKRIDSDPRAIFQLQNKIHIDNIFFNNLIKDLKKQIASEQDLNILAKLKLRQQVIRRIVWLEKSILDSVVWRLVRYNRPLLRMVCEKNMPTGNVTLDDDNFGEYIKNAFYIAIKNDSVVIINDLTNFLRLGDITSIKEGKCEFIELKRKGKRIISSNTVRNLNKNHLPKKEGIRILQVETLVNSNIMEGKEYGLDKNFKIKDIPLEYKTFLPSINSLLNKARRKGFSSKRLASYLYIQCINPKKPPSEDKIHEYLHNKNEYMVNNKDDEMYIVDNFDNLFFDDSGEFPRNIAPYLVFPLSFENVYSLFTGTLLIKSYLNISMIKREIESKGWIVTDNLKVNNSEVFSVGKIYENSKMDLNLEFRKDNCICGVSINLIMRIAYEYMDLSVITDYLEYIFKNPSQDKMNELYHINFINEENIWY